jgi:hypothetical protein
MAASFRSAFFSITFRMKLVLPTFLPEPETNTMFFEIGAIQMTF